MTPDLPPPLEVEVHGDLRMRADDLAQDVRLRAHPEAHLGPARVHLLGDLRGANDVSGASADAVPVGGWGELATPVGTVLVGRTPLPRWGLGIVANGGGCLDCPTDEIVDRLGFTTAIGQHYAGVAGDLGDNGARGVTAMAGRVPSVHQIRRTLDAGRASHGYGVWSHWRSEPALGLGVGTMDLWGRFDHGVFRAELEGAVAGGQAGGIVVDAVQVPVVDVAQQAGALQLAVSWVGLEVGGAQGADLLSANHRIGRILFRDTAVADAAWLRPGLTVEQERWTVRMGTTTAWTADGASTEVGATVWVNWEGLRLRTDVAALTSGGALAEGNVAWVF